MKSKIFPFVSSTIVIAMLVSFPERYLASSLDGLKIFALNVLPALLPFLFFSQLLTLLGAGRYIGRALSKPCKLLYNTSGVGGYIFALSILSGYPVGAKLLSECYKNGSITRSDACSIMSYTSTSGPMFVLGTVGTIMLRNKMGGIIILVCHYLSAILNGLLYRGKGGTSKAVITHTKNPLFESTKSAVNSVATCGAYIAIFYMVAVMLQDIGVIAWISKLFHPLLGSLSDGFVFGLVEITGGCIKLSQVNSVLTLPTICAIVTFGGLSVTLQSVTFLSECNISWKRYIVCKLTQSVIAYLLTYLAVLIFYPL